MNNDLQTLIRTGRGTVPADLVLKNITMLCVTTGEWITGDLAVADGIIIGAGEERYHGRREEDCTGLFAVPGFINTHVHVESCHALPAAYEKAVLPRGTTTAVCDPHELANVCGKAAIRYFLDCASCLRMDLQIQLSSCVPATTLETAGGELSAADLLEFAGHSCAGDLAEVMNFPGLLSEDPGVLAKVKAFQGQVIDGHAPLLSGKDLNAYIACGIANDHECSFPPEAMEKLRKGMNILIRSGSAAKNLPDLEPILTWKNVDSLALCVDDRNVLDIRSSGDIDALIRELIAGGAEPELAYRAASYSAAKMFRMHDRGMLAPGKIADVVILDDIRTCKVRRVLKRGIFADELPDLADMPDTAFARNSIRRKKVTLQDLQIPSRKTMTPVIRIIRDSLITDRVDAELSLNEKGFKEPDTTRDILKLFVLERHGRNGNIGRGFVQGFGLQRGAIASSVGHDSHNLCVTGRNDEDIMLAVNTLIGCGGGYAAAADGKILAKVEFPIGGLMSEKNFPELAAELKNLYAVLPQLGCKVADPFLQLAFLPLPVIPHLKLTDKGLVDVAKFDFIEV